MRFTGVDDLTKDQIALLRNGPPTTRVGWERLSFIATVAQEVLADPSVGRDNFSMQALVDKAKGKTSARSNLAIGTPYGYFAHSIDLMNFVWPQRADKFYTGPIEDRRY